MTIAMGARGLDQVRTRLRRLLLAAGVGFFAAVTGSVLVVDLANRLAPLLSRVESIWLQFAIGLLFSHLWVLAVLPPLAWVAARVVDARPWPFAVGAAAAGETFFVALGYATGAGAEWRDILGRTVALAAGVSLSAWAARKGKQASARALERARQAAEARKAEYETFIRDAERLAERSPAESSKAD